MMCLGRTDPEGLYRRYLRELVIVEEWGTPGHQRSLARRYGRYLGGHRMHLDALSDEECQDVFLDALRPRDGNNPVTDLGWALAFPDWFSRRVERPGDVWLDLSRYEPAGLAVDPVCDMYVDPSRTGYVLDRGDRKFFFCCPRCFNRFRNRLMFPADRWLWRL